MFIYKIINNVNGKIYIGRTSKTIEKRYWEHLHDSKTKSGHYLANAIRKYGEENFNIVKLCRCGNFDLLKKMETFFIKKFHSMHNENGYNLLYEDNGKQFVSDEMRKNISNSLKGRATRGRGWHHSKKTKELIKKKLKEIFNTDEMRQKSSLSRKGVKLTEEQKQFIGKIHKGRKRSLKTRQRMRKSAILAHKRRKNQ